jgi:predicted RNA-binding protein with RPS1 domain
MCGSRFDADPHSRVSDKVDVVVKDVWQNDGTIVVSEIGALLVAYADDVVIGEQLTATVDAVTEYGAFVAVENQHPLKGLKGLVHVSEMSWSQVSDPRKLLEPGEEVYVSVKGVDWSKLGLQLSMKELEQDPLFENIDTLFPTDGDDADLSSDDLEAEDSLPGLLSLKTQLEQTEDIDRVAFGRRAVERSAVAQNLEVWLAQLKSNDDAFRVVARDGRLAQEVRVHAGEMSREQLRAVLSQIMEKY